MTAGDADPERRRLAAANDGTEPWRDWGPYLAERAWGSVREDYSADGDAWVSFPHDHARSRAYRWNEDGMAGFCDLDQNWCLALALWNGVDPILKERMFGLTGPQGNHGEDVKEYWWYTDATPTHSWNSWRYHYPQAPYPYEDLVATNAARTKTEPEYELLDTGIFDTSRYWVVSVDYAKEGPHDLRMQITVENAGPVRATLRVLPTLWFRNTWSWGDDKVVRPRLRADASSIVGESAHAGTLRLTGEGTPRVLFCDNETNARRLYGVDQGPEFPKDGINDFVVAGTPSVNPALEGTKAALDYEITVEPGATTTIRVRLSEEAPDLHDPFPPLLDVAAFDHTIATRRDEADQYWSSITPARSSRDEARVLRQAMAGLLWSKQFYNFNVKRWLSGDPSSPPPPPEHAYNRNRDWVHLHAHDVLLMPDVWEYPWFANWDLAFHCVTMAHIDPEFAKAQLVLMLRECYMHSSGQLPAYEWNFSDVNPPTHAWAALQVFVLDGSRDFDFLAKVFHKLMVNFTWWINAKGHNDDGVFTGGFLGLDNIAPLNRSTLPEAGDTIEQADATAWMAMYSLDLLNMALRLANRNVAYEDVASKFAEHFLRIAAAENNSGMWDDEDAFFYDVVHLVDGREIPLKVCSLVGLVPVLASFVYHESSVSHLEDFRSRLAWFLAHNHEQAAAYQTRGEGDVAHLLTLVDSERLTRILSKVLDEEALLSPFGIRSISAHHRDHPFAIDINGVRASVDYEPGESTSGLFGGNSNWRGPVWFPLNVLFIEALRNYETHYPGDVVVEFPKGSGVSMTLDAVSDALSQRLISLFIPAEDGVRPSDARYATLVSDPRWRPYILFYEYFDGDTGQGLGASHQTGWTSTVAHLILQSGDRRMEL
ncbi:MAG: glucosidase [Acidimicrobiaceae bacterium]|nr:glucosidase [Acidimicrobiaceae bacterium]